MSFFTTFVVSAISGKLSTFYGTSIWEKHEFTHVDDHSVSVINYIIPVCLTYAALLWIYDSIIFWSLLNERPMTIYCLADKWIFYGNVIKNPEINTYNAPASFSDIFVACSDMSLCLFSFSLLKPGGGIFRFHPNIFISEQFSANTYQIYLRILLWAAECRCFHLSHGRSGFNSRLCLEKHPV